MLLELMSNGTLAELPPEHTPDGLRLPDDSSVMLLLPHNKYLLGTGRDKWIYASEKPGTQPQDVYLYDNQGLSLLNEGSQPTILPATTVTALRKQLSQRTAPPGDHTAAVLMLRTFMRNHEIFTSSGNDFLDEQYFLQAMKSDITLCKVYWTLRFALSRSEMETTGRLKAWLKADPEIFTRPEYAAKIWFSILDIPDEEAISEIEELSFTRLELERMTAQNVSPLVVYNPASGWLVLGRFGRDKSTMFFAWVFLNHELWGELREKKKLTVNDIVSAVWGEYDVRHAMNERARYKGADITA